LNEIQGQDGTNQYTKDYSSFQFKRIKGPSISITSVTENISYGWRGKVKKGEK